MVLFSNPLPLDLSIRVILSLQCSIKKIKFYIVSCFNLNLVHSVFSDFFEPFCLVDLLTESTGS